MDPELFEDDEEDEEDGSIGSMVRVESLEVEGLEVEVELEVDVADGICRGCELVKVELESVVESELDPLDLLLLLDVMTCTD